MASVTWDSVEKITVPILYHIRYQSDLICIAKTIGSPKKKCQSDLNICLDRRSPTLLIHTEIMTLLKSRRVLHVQVITWMYGGIHALCMHGSVSNVNNKQTTEGMTDKKILRKTDG